MNEKLITEEQCKIILTRYLQQSSNFENNCNTDDTINDRCKTNKAQDLSSYNEHITLTSFSIHPLDNQYDGLIGEQFYLTIKYQQEQKHKQVKFFVKILSKSNQIMYDIAKVIKAFEKESFFYEKYIPYLREEGFACSYVPKCYFFESEIIVLENLHDVFYKTFGKNVSLDIQHCKMCLETIARFHADSVLLELKKSKELSWEYKLSEAFPEIFQNELESNWLVVKYYTYGIIGLKKLMELIPEDSIKLEEYINLFNKAVDNIPEIQEQAKTKFKNVLSHNDLWCSNIFYRYEKVNELKKVVSCKLVDFQTITLKPPIVDVLGFIYLNTRKSFRDIYMVDLIWHYFCCFSDIVEEAGYSVRDVFSPKEFYSSFEFLRITSKIHCIIDRSFTLIPDEVYVQYLQSEETFSNFLFEGRPDIMVELFNTNQVYKEIMTEELCELRTLLSSQPKL